MIILFIVILGTAVGTYLFVKKNKKKVEALENLGDKVAEKANDLIKNVKK